MQKSFRNTIYILFALTSSVNAQPNLVPNNSFENYSFCPYGPSNIDQAIGWFQPNNYSSSSDYFNTCATNYVGSVPTNLVGFQYPKSGNAYAGIILFSYPQQSNYREYIEAELTDSLIAGEAYCASFYVTLANYMRYGTDRIGAYLSTNPVYNFSITYQPILVLPQVENSSGNVISDTSNWTLIKGSFIANGNEKYITIGNFYNDINSNSVLIHPAQQKSWAYYYIDDVRVFHGICSTGIGEEIQLEKSILLYPNPAKESVTVNKSADEYINIWSVDGKRLLDDHTNSTVDVSKWDDGIYIARTTTKDGRYRIGKLIISK